MHSEREPDLAVHFCKTTKGQCSRRMKHILLTQWGILNLFSFLFRIKIDFLRLQNIIQKPQRSDLLSACIQLCVPVEPAKSHLALLSDISIDWSIPVFKFGTFNTFTARSDSHLHHSTEHIWLHLSVPQRLPQTIMVESRMYFYSSAVLNYIFEAL